MPENPDDQLPTFSFYKGTENVLAIADGTAFDWDASARIVREHLTEALNAQNLSFLLGSGCSSLAVNNKQLGIPTMAPLAKEFVETIGEKGGAFPSQAERELLRTILGLKLNGDPFSSNLERLLEVLLSFEFSLINSSEEGLRKVIPTLQEVIQKTITFISDRCQNGDFSKGDESVLKLYQSFYRRLEHRERSRSRPWVFTTNYDLFNETALDRLGTPYANGFSGSVERRFNPASYRYALAERMDISNQRWSAVDSFIYLCKLHGSINWVEDDLSLFKIREADTSSIDPKQRVMIYPTPTKQNSSFGAPYSDLFREFQSKIAQEQSVLICLGYGFGDEHINNLIFQALTVPSFRLIAFVPPAAKDTIASLRELGDPRIWMIGGDGPTKDRRAHYFDTFVEHFLPQAPGAEVDQALQRVMKLISSPTPSGDDDGEG